MKQSTCTKGFAGLVLGVALALIPAPSQADILLDFTSLANASIHFDGVGNFSFLPATSGHQFSITRSSGSGDSIGDKGYISGTWAIGPVVNLGGGVQYAPVTGSGGLTISDGVNTLTANLSWNDMLTVGVGGLINVQGVLNLSDISYGGGQSDLKALAAVGTGTQTLSFTFIPAHNLTYLKGTAADTAFSGELTAVPETTTFIAGAGALGLLLLGLGAKSRRSGAIRIGK